MHPLASVKESDLNQLVRAAAHLLNTQRLLSPGNRNNPMQAGTGIEFLDHREFVSGDNPRDIDWRASARSRHRQIRRYCEEASSDWFIALDCSASMSIGTGKKWALSLQSAAAIAYLLLHLGNRVSVLAFSNRIEQMTPLGRGYGHYGKILQALRQVTPTDCGHDSRLDSCVSRIKRNSPLVVISDFLTDDAMTNALTSLNSRGDRVHALQMLSALDQEVPAQGHIRMQDIETGRSLDVAIEMDESLVIRQRLNSLFDDLNTHCQKLKIRYSRHMEHENWQSAVISHLRQKSGLS